MERVKTCRALLEYFIDEYAHVGDKWFINETLDPEKMVIFKKLAKMVESAHEVYHISLELAHGTERDWHGDYAHSHKVMAGGHAMPVRMYPGKHDGDVETMDNPRPK